ncbi:MAG: HNH endonuclease [Leptolyngbya sp. SIO1D8]|nr:HNH endonuclease [Leptolyngbya sp. SIO1D8]
MPWNRSLYPANWEAIASQVKTEANWQCQQCGRPCQRPDESPLAFMERIRTSRVSECPVVREYGLHPRRWMLTVAHLDHRPENCDRANLKALCTPCHCRYDLSQMARKQMLKRERNGQLTLLD